jgi:hypothetical protein
LYRQDCGSSFTLLENDSAKTSFSQDGKSPRPTKLISDHIPRGSERRVFGPTSRKPVKPPPRRYVEGKESFREE